MTTVDKILLKLDYVTKEQEDELAFFALDDVINHFENANHFRIVNQNHFLCLIRITFLLNQITFC